MHCRARANAGWFLFVALALVSGGAACSGSSSTNSSCTESTAPTYENFGRQFVATYCASCHAGTQAGAARQGAPTDYVFDSLAEIRQHAVAMHMDVVELKIMPFGSSSLKPSDGERTKLGAWLDCGAP